MNAVNVGILLQKELRDALRNRWLWLFAGAFAVLAVALGALALTSIAATVAFSRTLAGLINLAILLVPLFGLSLGAQAIAGERERRTLPYLLAQPVGRADVLLGKYLGLALAFTAALALGFGLAGIPLGPSGVDASMFGALAGLALLLGLAMLSIGMLLSVLTRRTSIAIGVGLFVWFVLVLAGDLGLMGTTMALRLRADAVFLLALLNPLEVFKLASVLAIRPNLEVLGPAGLYGASTFGAWLGPILVAILAAWVVAPLVLANFVFARSSEP